MDWFERLTGFREDNYELARSQLRINEEGRLVSLANRVSYGVGKLGLPSLRELREQIETTGRGAGGRLSVSVLRGDARALHRQCEFQGALFQVASQFNLLEMTGPNVTPEQGVTRYEHDQTQGPACAIAAGAATIYRNYFVPFGDAFGQTGDPADRHAGRRRRRIERCPRQAGPVLWEMRNGYALCSRSGLEAIAAYLATLPAEDRDALGAKLRIGLHRDVEVTDATAVPAPCHFASLLFRAAGRLRRPDPGRIFGSPSPASFSRRPMRRRCWRAPATALGASETVLLTLVGGGVFGNREAWILDAIRRALRRVAEFALDVRIVSYAEPSRASSIWSPNSIRLERDAGALFDDAIIGPEHPRRDAAKGPPAFGDFLSACASGRFLRPSAGAPPPAARDRRREKRRDGRGRTAGKCRRSTARRHAPSISARAPPRVARAERGEIEPLARHLMGQRAQRPHFRRRKAAARARPPLRLRSGVAASSGASSVSSRPKIAIGAGDRDLLRDDDRRKAGKSRLAPPQRRRAADLDKPGDRSGSRARARAAARRARPRRRSARPARSGAGAACGGARFFETSSAARCSLRPSALAPDVPLRAVAQWAAASRPRLFRAHATELAARRGGRLLLRIEDTDPTRCRPRIRDGDREDLVARRRIRGRPRRQSEHLDDYAGARRAATRGLVYPCYCTRGQISRGERRARSRRRAAASRALRRGAPRRRGARLARGERRGWRLACARARRRRSAADLARIRRGRRERASSRPSRSVGRRRAARKERPANYHLAVVVDDALQAVTRRRARPRPLRRDVDPSVAAGAARICRRRAIAIIGSCSTTNGDKMSKSATSKPLARCASGRLRRRDSRARSASAGRRARRSRCVSVDLGATVAGAAALGVGRLRHQLVDPVALLLEGASILPSNSRVRASLIAIGSTKLPLMMTS